MNVQIHQDNNLGGFHREGFCQGDCMKSGTLVVLSAPGYTGRLAHVEYETIRSTANARQFRLVLRGSHSRLTFKVGEFSEATPEQVQWAMAHPQEKSYDPKIG